MNILLVITWVLVIWFVFYVVSALGTRIMAKQRGTVLKAEDFMAQQAENHGQLVDVRDKEPYKRNHLRGARNMPALTFSQGKSGLRQDMPVYLYGDTLSGASSVARHLRKEGMAKSQIFLMAGGYRQVTEQKKS
ncbi:MULTISPECIES: rhodanese-like domain-containing protein [Fructobacillus]|jgi:rhodanese-related sulfurtransferase|uniref:Rhodanese-related sulfurtransferase n=2 Tax=Fructobacillus TaxID=559173 RepID=A0A3F3H1D4_9LACO|nr:MULTISPECIES: rhodanese-like domain-containing protein [Fructobacillus]MCK8627441.1 rhodanese-like domain-containing protein [Fructobacillus cardui]NLS38135.1 rhodanese-like domain-containing protein [Fructobacillus tropaeoli]CAK1231105.1 Rhodanese-related sulfurtransferase (PspE) [Fructobacillus tropaeoli]CAK1231183.1 Rhodanese-related sulfurtransferase (PspE) [Fructobacillus tropaeoli]CAK1232542.1 Rhodanese-related sulfurtransferase (PspE) [Fructobacillus tropaeoli]